MATAMAVLVRLYQQTKGMKQMQKLKTMMNFQQTLTLTRSAVIANSLHHNATANEAEQGDLRIRQLSALLACNNSMLMPCSNSKRHRQRKAETVAEAEAEAD